MRKRGYTVSLLCILTVFGFIFSSDSVFAAAAFTGQLNSDNINVRSDSTVSSAVITTLNKNEPVEVVQELYEWCRIRLPRHSPAFIRKDLVLRLDEKSGRVLRNSCNIRLRPDENAPILGRADKDELLGIIQESGDWYRVMPPENTFGWVHRRFVDASGNKTQPLLSEHAKSEGVKNDGLGVLSNKIERAADKISKHDQPVLISANEDVAIEGVVESYGKVFKRKGTHKLVTVDDKIYLLKGNPKNLDSVTGYRVRISGMMTGDKTQKYPVIEIRKLEILN